jgi:hypothetical protein
MGHVFISIVKLVVENDMEAAPADLGAVPGCDGPSQLFFFLNSLILSAKVVMRISNGGSNTGGDEELGLEICVLEERQRQVGAIALEKLTV